MAVHKQIYIHNGNIRISKSAFVDITVTIFIFCSTFVKFPSVSLYLVLFSAALILLCVKNFRAVIVGLCIGGMPFFSLAKSVLGFSITQTIMGMIGIQMLLLLLHSRSTLTSGGNKSRLLIYCWLIAAIYLLVLVSFVLAPQTDYNMYYIQYFFIYGTFFCLGGLLVVQSSVRLKDLLLPVMLFFVCAYPMFNFTLLNIPSSISARAIGIRGLEGLGSILLGRLSGGLVVLVFCIIWETINVKKRRILYIQIALALIISLPMLWYTQTRQAMIAMALIIIMSPLFLSMHIRKWPLRQRVFLLLVPIVFIWGSYTFLNWSEQHLAQVRVYVQLGDSPRHYQWQYALEGISKNPIVGYGLGGYYSQYGIWPHNWVLEALHDYGLVGLMLLCGPILVVFVRLYYRQTVHYFWLLLGVYWIIVAQASADIPRNTTMFFFFTIALLSGLRRPRRKEGSKSRIRLSPMAATMEA